MCLGMNLFACFGCWVYTLSVEIEALQFWEIFLGLITSYPQSAKTRPGAACGSDHELLIANFRLKLRKVGKTTRKFRYDLNEIL